MAATITSSKLERDVPAPFQSVTVATLQDSVPVTITLLGPSGVAPSSILHMITTPPTDNSLLNMAWTGSSNTLGGTNTATVIFFGNGDLSGAVVKLLITYGQIATGGISA